MFSPTFIDDRPLRRHRPMAMLNGWPREMATWNEYLPRLRRVDRSEI